MKEEELEPLFTKGRKFVNKWTNNARVSWNPSRAMLVISNEKRLEWWI